MRNGVVNNAKKHMQMSRFGGVRQPTSSWPNRPVTPEVAGSSPVAPVDPFTLQNRILCCLNGLGGRDTGQQTGSTTAGPHSVKYLQIGIFLKNSYPSVHGFP